MARPFARRWLLFSWVVASGLALAPELLAQPVEKEVLFYGDGAAPGVRVRPWSMKWQEVPGGETEDGKCLWLNTDWTAHPWAGVNFTGQAGAGLVLDQDWLDRGFLCFHLNSGTDRYGFPGGSVSLQVRPDVAGVRYQALRGTFIDRGRGGDEDKATWQEVLVPLSYWTTLKPGSQVTGVSIQCRLQPKISFGLDRVALVRFASRPEWLEQKLREDVAQPWVKWPTYDELPALLKADQHPPRVVDGQFAWPNGKRAFMINPYCREDARLDLWGTTKEDRRAPAHGLYDPKAHGWIYQELATAQGLCRLGFNSFSATMPPQPWWDSVGYKRRNSGSSPERLPEFYKSARLPFYVDTVAWPWTLGAPSSPKDNNLPPEAFTQGRHHWTPYRTIGRGRDAWLSMWRVYAQRYRDLGVPVLLFELMNEPAYVGVSEDHRAEFAAWIKKRYGTLAHLNATWRAELASWEQAAQGGSRADMKQIPGRYFDYDEYLAERFTALVGAGVQAVTRLLPETLVGLQTMGGYALRPRESVWKHHIVPHETAVITPTGGGRWTAGRAGSKAAAEPLLSPIAGAPIENDLLLALAGGKMIFDNETYLRGQTAVEVRNRLWQHVLAGLDGLTVFSWSRRGWAWWKTRKQVQTEADKFPYCALNPLARRTAALRGVLDFSLEVQPLADRILRKPWGPKPRIAVLYSWVQARWVHIQPDRPDKTPAYYAALKYTHWNLAVVPSNQAAAGALDGHDVVVVAGVRHIEPDVVEALAAFVRGGGVLIVGEEPFDRDLYDRVVATDSLLGAKLGPSQAREGAALVLSSPSAQEALPGTVSLRAGARALTALPGTEVFAADDAGAPIVTRRGLGKGLVYVQAADLIGYPLAKVLWAVLADAAAAKGRRGVPPEWRLADIGREDRPGLEPNVLLSRRSHADYHALLLMNRDECDKRVVLKLDGLQGDWTVKECLSNTPLSGPKRGTWSAADLANGIPLSLSAGHPAVVMIDRAGRP